MHAFDSASRAHWDENHHRLFAHRETSIRRDSTRTVRTSTDRIAIDGFHLPRYS